MRSMAVDTISHQTSSDILRLSARIKGLIASVVICIVGLSLYIPFASDTLYHDDSVGYALAIHQFNLKLHQPAVPGYPLYILALRAIQFVSGASDNYTM